MVDFLLSSFLVYQYWLLFGVCIFAAFGFPLPATALLLVGGALYAQGYFDIKYLFLAGFAGCIIGDNLGYGLSYVYGKSIFVGMKLTRFIDIDGILSRYGPGFIKKSIITVFFTRWAVTGLGPSVNIVAGLTKMYPAKFIMIDIIGEFLYVMIYILIGYSFGSEWELILDVVESFSFMIISGVLLGIGLYFFSKHGKRNNIETLFPEEEL